MVAEGVPELGATLFSHENDLSTASLTDLFTSFSQPTQASCATKMQTADDVYLFASAPSPTCSALSDDPSLSSNSDDDGSVLSIQSPIAFGAQHTFEKFMGYPPSGFGMDDVPAATSLTAPLDLYSVKTEPREGKKYQPYTQATTKTTSSCVLQNVDHKQGQKRKKARPDLEPRRLHQCSWCPKRFVTTGHLKQHVRIHTGDRPFKCTWCEKAFAQCGDLKRHERIHTGEKPFSCGKCGKSFAQCGNLKKHERIHLRENTEGSDELQSTANPETPDMCDTVLATSPPANNDDDMDGEEDKETKLERSRRNARQSRMRKKEYVTTLEAKVSTMEKEDACTKAELKRTQQQLADLLTKHEALLLKVGKAMPAQSQLTLC